MILVLLSMIPSCADIETETTGKAIVSMRLEQDRSSHRSAFKGITPEEANEYDFEEGSMGPKVEAACDFVARSGGRAVIGALSDMQGMVDGTAGTQFILR